VASGAAPGVAITFLMAGAGTNIAELLTINRTIGKRSMILYFALVVVISNCVGYLTNRMFPDFKPVLNFDAATRSISTANRLIISFPEWLNYSCSAVLACFAVWSLARYIRKKLDKRGAVVSG
jgi:predicted small integral membrane protein